MAAKTLFRQSDNDELVQRIQALRHDTRPVWGKMNAAQMLAHCQVPIRVATGEVKLGRGLLGVLFGKLAKKTLLRDEPTRRNLPTDKSFVVKDERDFTRERDLLIALVRRFGQGGEAGLTREPHPFFGPLTTEEWEALMWKHLDHHLQQFGA